MSRFATGIVVVAAVALMSLSPQAIVSAQPLGRWLPGYTATFYGGQGDGGSCGYGTAKQSGFGYSSASVSNVIYAAGAICGACIQVRCVNSPKCIPGTVSPPLTVTNQCPQSSSGGWCAGNKLSVSLSPSIWSKIANNPESGVVPAQIKRVNCPRTHGVLFNVTGNAYYATVLIKNVGGTGDLAGVSVMLDKGPWIPLMRVYGAVWQLAGQNMAGKTLSFRLTTRADRRSVTVMNAIGPDWESPTIVKAAVNF